jgi:hypothetical protein
MSRSQLELACEEETRYIYRSRQRASYSQRILARARACLQQKWLGCHDRNHNLCRNLPCRPHCLYCDASEASSEENQGKWWTLEAEIETPPPSKLLRFFFRHPTSMKFGETLKRTATPEWKLMYMDYKALKKLISQWSVYSAEVNFRPEIIDKAEKGRSLPTH